MSSLAALALWQAYTNIPVEALTEVLALAWLSKVAFCFSSKAVVEHTQPGPNSYVKTPGSVEFLPVHLGKWSPAISMGISASWDSRDEKPDRVAREVYTLVRLRLSVVPSVSDLTSFQ